MNTSDSIQQQLQEAVTGMLYQSESDFPFEVISFPPTEEPLTNETVARLLQLSPETEFETQEAASFFKPLATELNWYGNEERETAGRYRALQNLIAQSLSGARVFRYGETNVQIVILGKTDDNTVAGLKTQAVET